MQINGAGALGGTTPHADPRDLVFLGNNTLLEVDDGGFYFIQNPTNAAANSWNSFNGNLGAFELYSVAYDSTNDVIITGTQDNGSPHQNGRRRPHLDPAAGRGRTVPGCRHDVTGRRCSSAIR